MKFLVAILFIMLNWHFASNRFEDKLRMFTNASPKLKRLYVLLKAWPFKLTPIQHIFLILPLVTWLLLFQVAAVIPSSVRPSINVSFLPFFEAMLFGSPLLFEMFPPSNLLVFLAAVPYLAHFSLPFIFGAYLLYRRKQVTIFLFYFGILNLTAVLTHLSFPTAPPWYNEVYGFEPATYDVQGDPGRLRNADLMLDFPLFQSLYGTSPVVFGSFPSLHAGWPLLIAFYSSMIAIPLSIYLKCFYVCWIWWAAVFTKHHFLLDVLGGAFYTFIAITFVDYLKTKKTFAFLKEDDPHGKVQVPDFI